jgi:hypothetical protein
MALGAITTITKAGITPSYATPLSSEVISSSTAFFLHVKNTNAASLTVTLVDPGLTAAGSSPVNPTVTVPANTGDKMIYIPLAFVNAGSATINFSITSSVTGALFILG